MIRRRQCKIAEMTTVDPRAEQSARDWLAKADAGAGADTWRETGSRFRAAVTEDDWTRKLAGVRPPLGALQSRALKSAQAANELPGAPDSEYVVFQFDSAFDKKRSAVETVTVEKEDGAWRVVGYFIR